MKINIEYDSSSKKGSVRKDGIEIEHFSSLRFHKVGDDEYMLTIEEVEVPEEGVVKYATTYAEETKQALADYLMPGDK